MKTTFTLLFTSFLMLFANVAFALNANVWAALVSPASGAGSGNITSVTIRVVHDYNTDQNITVNLLTVAGSAAAVTNSDYLVEDLTTGSGNTLVTVPMNKYVEYTFTFSNPAVPATSAFEVEVLNPANPATNNTYTMSQSNPLPVTLVRFEAKTKGAELALNWATASEKNSSHFEIERSFDGSEFAKIGSVNATGNTTSLHNYSFRTNNVNAVSYFRLKMVDMDGSIAYSNIVTVKKAEVATVAVNINNAAVTAEIGADEQITRVMITDLRGQVVYDNAGPATAIVTNHSGIAIVRIFTEKNAYQAKTFIQQ